MAINGESRRETQNNRYELRNRYIFEGDVVLQTALHIGGGKVTLSSSDSPIVLTPDQKPFIPGSSFKGALRSAVEKIVPSLPTSARLSSCALIELQDEQVKMPPVARDEKPQWPAGVCPTVWQGGLTRLKREYARWEREILNDATKNICNTCQLFGSPFAAAHLNVDDLYLSTEEWSGVTQIRDGVAIERDSETAKPRLKYDFEVVPASVTFKLRIVLENATDADLQLISVGLSEFVHGFGVVGGKRSRGLGVSKLEKLQVSTLDLADPTLGKQQLRDYLLTRKLPNVPGEEFLQQHISSIFGE